MEYYLPIRVRYVLFTTQCLSSVLCDSDELCYGGNVRALDSDHLLRRGNIYFVLPAKCLHHPLTAAEMAALASRANTALAKAASAAASKKKKMLGRGGVWKGVRILPTVVAAEVSGDGYERINEECVFCGGGSEVPMAIQQEGNTTGDEIENLTAKTEQEIQNLPAKTEQDIHEGEKLSEEEFEKFLEEMAERSQNQLKLNFYRRKRFASNLSTIPEEYELY